MLSTVVRLLVVGACFLGIWSSWTLARAEGLFQQHTEESVRAAIRLQPDAWRYYTVLSQIDPAHEEELLIRSLQLDPYNATANIELGLYVESNGDYARAEKFLLEAFAIDRTFVTRWALANFYFRRGDEQAFWLWARKAASMPSERMGALFELCWHESPDPDKISSEILTDNPDLVRQYMQFLLLKNQLPAATSAARRLVPHGDPKTDRPELLALVNRLLADNKGPAAMGLWRDLASYKWVEADSTLINNPTFGRHPVGVDFDWYVPALGGLNSSTGPEGLKTEFTGDEPESCVVTGQSVVLTPGKYSLLYSYDTNQIAPGSGLKWQVVAPGYDRPLAESGDLSSDNPRQETFGFAVPQGVSLIRIRLVYERALGTTRISGGLHLTSVQLRPEAQ